MKYIIFYSWQSDLPNNTNRGFIESVIKKAIKDVKKSEEYELEPSFDRDTQGIPGAPNITQAILEKISSCDAFVADISIVTGNVENNQRLSPNPNVLIELGYAIALLGWDKIILFCNEAYGTDEDLPFDIRQHRRISYNLQQESVKTEIKQSLISQFKNRLVELLKNGKSKSDIKIPNILINWNYWDINNGCDSNNGVDTNIINLSRISDMSNLNQKIEKEIKNVRSIDGSIDPNWQEKIDNYLDDANTFIKDFNETIKRNKFLMNANINNVNLVTLTVENNGNAPASDIRVELKLPNWIICFERLPDKGDIPVIPKVPVPSKPRATDFMSNMSSMAKIVNNRSNINLSSLANNLNRTSDCILQNNTISFWADKLLHKHSITNTNSRLYFIANSNAPMGEFIIKGKSFCVEYDDWSEVELIIKIV